MIAVSVAQPWAWLIVEGWCQSIEKPWATTTRGRVLIHAADAIDPAGYAWCRRTWPKRRVPEGAYLARGAVVGRADLVACTEIAGRGDRRRWRLLFATAERLELLPMAAPADLFPVPAEALA